MKETLIPIGDKLAVSLWMEIVTYKINYYNSLPLKKNSLCVYLSSICSRRHNDGETLFGINGNSFSLHRYFMMQISKSLRTATKRDVRYDLNAKLEIYVNQFSIKLTHNGDRLDVWKLRERKWSFFDNT